MRHLHGCIQGFQIVVLCLTYKFYQYNITKFFTNKKTQTEKRLFNLKILFAQDPGLGRLKVRNVGIYNYLIDLNI